MSILLCFRPTLGPSNSRNGVRRGDGRYRGRHQKDKTTTQVGQNPMSNHELIDRRSTKGLPENKCSLVRCLTPWCLKFLLNFFGSGSPSHVTTHRYTLKYLSMLSPISHSSGVTTMSLLTLKGVLYRRRVLTPRSRCGGSSPDTGNWCGK